MTQTIINIIITIIISTGIVSALVSYNQKKRIRIHELKLKKYFILIEELSKLLAKNTEAEKLNKILNEALFFAHNNVVREILRFNKLYAEKEKQVKKINRNIIEITEKDLTPLIKAVRSELHLKSKSIDKEGLRFFQKPGG